MNTEAIVYLLRKTNLTHEAIGKLNPQQFNEIVGEVYFQESVDEYRKQYAIASLMAAIYNTVPRKSGKVFKARDFIQGERPSRGKGRDEIEELAQKHNIKLPSKELKRRGE